MTQSATSAGKSSRNPGAASPPLTAMTSVVTTTAAHGGASAKRSPRRNANTVATIASSTSMDADE
jgi:hypothetical protein